MSDPTDRGPVDPAHLGGHELPSDVEGRLTSWVGHDGLRNALADSLPGFEYCAPLTGGGSGSFRGTRPLPKGMTLDRGLGHREVIERWLHPDDRDRALGHLDHIQALGSKFDCKYRLLWDDGSVCWFHDRGRVIRVEGEDDNGAGCTLLVGFMHDVTSARDSLSRQHRLAAVVEQSPNMVIVTNLDGDIEYVNRAFEEVTGYTRGEAIGNNPRILKSGDRDPGFYQGMWDTLQRGEVWTMVIPNLRKDGSSYMQRSAIYPLRNLEGDVDHYVGLAHDVTAELEMADALQSALRAAEEASDAKSRFLANMSHEIRTPLNAIIGMADLLWEGQLAPEQRDYVQVFRTAGETLLSLINQLLDLSRLEADTIELEHIDFSLREVVEGTVSVLAPVGHLKGIEIAARLDAEVPEWVTGDPARLRQVVTNLVGNAIKFTSQGEVVVDVRMAEAPAGFVATGPSRSDDDRPRTDPMSFVIEVHDTGVGIPADKLETVFERFTQADSSTTRRFGGSGLGLTITRDLVEVMGGRVWAESSEGRGSTFFVSVPLAVAQSPDVHPLDIAEIRGLRTLIVDDNATNRLIFRELMNSWGARTVEVASGTAALDELGLEANDPRYDLVLLDGEMPDMDGYDVAEAIQSRFGTEAPAVIMLTSNRARGEVERATGFGVAEHLLKPIRRSRLLDAVLDALGGSA